MIPAALNQKESWPIWAVLPRLNLIPAKGRKITGWLIDKLGYLSAVYNCRADFMVGHIPVNNHLCLAALSSVNKYHFQNNANLSGSLIYFTRGPDQEYFKISPQKI